jgi:hypothetical protein
MPSVNLYQIPQVINTTQAGGVGVNSATNKIDFDVSKHVSTDIEFLLKDIDNKAISLTGKSMIIYIVDRSINRVMMQRKLTVMNAPRGHCRLTINPVDIMNWDLGCYSYTITIDHDGKQSLVHQSKNRSQYGFMELTEGPLPSPRSATVITPEEMQLDNNDLGLFKKYISGAYPGAAQRDNHTGMHSLSIYANNMSGSFYIQASLENGVPTSVQEWFDVEIYHHDVPQQEHHCQVSNHQDVVNSRYVFKNLTGVHNIQFKGSFMWVRFVFVPEIEELTMEPVDKTGKLKMITKMLFKN